MSLADQGELRFDWLIKSTLRAVTTGPTSAGLGPTVPHWVGGASRVGHRRWAFMGVAKSQKRTSSGSLLNLYKLSAAPRLPPPDTKCYLTAAKVVLTVRNSSGHQLLVLVFSSETILYRLPFLKQLSQSLHSQRVVVGEQNSSLSHAVLHRRMHCNHTRAGKRINGLRECWNYMGNAGELDDLSKIRGWHRCPACLQPIPKPRIL